MLSEVKVVFEVAFFIKKKLYIYIQIYEYYLIFLISEDFLVYRWRCLEDRESSDFDKIYPNSQFFSRGAGARKPPIENQGNTDFPH